MTDFDREPDGGPDEDCYVGIVNVTASTATQQAAKDWVFSDGAERVLGIYEGGSRRALPDGLKLNHLTVSLPPCDALPERVDVADLLRSGLAKGWWEFDVSAATEEDENADWRVEADRRDAESTAESKRRAADDRGPWWWRARCGVAEWMRSAAERARPDDIGEVFWLEGRALVTRRVRRRDVDRSQAF